MERTFFPGRGYWRVYGAILSLWTMWIGVAIFSTQVEGEPAELRWHSSSKLWWTIAVAGVSLSAAAFYGILVYWRKRLIICADEVRSYGALFVRTIRFVDVIEARWLWIRIKNRERHYGLRLCTPTNGLTIYFDHFVPEGAEDELIGLLRQRLGPNVRQIWGPSPSVLRRREIVQAVREGRASYWAPPVCTIKSVSRMLAVATGFAGAFGAGFGFLLHHEPHIAQLWADAANKRQVGNLLQISIPGAVEQMWSGSLPLDWGLSGAILALIGGILFLSFFALLEWAGRKWQIVQARSWDRAMISPVLELIQPPSDSRGGWNMR